MMLQKTCCRERRCGSQPQQIFHRDNRLSPGRQPLKTGIVIFYKTKHFKIFSLDCETAAVNGSLVPYIIQESQKSIVKKKIID
jgi:hypothetical protein